MEEIGDFFDNLNNTLSGQQAVQAEIKVNLDLEDILSIAGAVAGGVLIGMLLFEGVMYLIEK